MNVKTLKILDRWQSLEKDGGVQRTAWKGWALWAAGAALTGLAFYGCFHGLNPSYIFVLSGAGATVIARGEALRDRAREWPIVRTYIDWSKVKADLGISHRLF